VTTRKHEIEEGMRDLLETCPQCNEGVVEIELRRVLANNTIAVSRLCFDCARDLYQTGEYYSHRTL
jgi:hypothetical protein